MTTAERRGQKGSGRVVLTFEEPGRSPVELTAFEVRMAYRTLYNAKQGKRKGGPEETEIERSMAESGVPT